MKSSTYPQIFLLLWSILALSVLSCEQSDVEKQTENIARVGNEYLTLDQAKEAIPSFMYKEDSTSALEQYRQQWIQRKLVLQEADELDLRQRKEIRKKLRRAQHEVLREALRTHIISSQVDTVVTDEEVEAYYQSNKEHFELGELYVQYRHLRTEDIEDARTAKQALQRGTSWKEVADQYAMEPPLSIKNAQQYRPISTVLEDNDMMHRYLQTIDVDEISPIQRVNGMYHFVQLTGKREQNDSADIEWVKEKVKKWIILDKRQRKFNSYLKNLYLKAESDNEIEVYNVLPTKHNSKKTHTDTLESNSTDE